MTYLFRGTILLYASKESTNYPHPMPLSEGQDAQKSQVEVPDRTNGGQGQASMQGDRWEWVIRIQAIASGSVGNIGNRLTEQVGWLLALWLSYEVSVVAGLVGGTVGEALKWTEDVSIRISKMKFSSGCCGVSGAVDVMRSWAVNFEWVKVARSQLQCVCVVVIDLVVKGTGPCRNGMIFANIVNSKQVLNVGVDGGISERLGACITSRGRSRAFMGQWLVEEGKMVSMD